MSLRSASTFLSNPIPSIILDLRRITNRTREEATTEGLQTEAWLVAEELSRDREPPPDVSDKSFHQQVLGRLYNRFMEFADRRLRGTVRIDKQHSDDDGAIRESSIAATLAAQDDSDPPKAVETRGSEHEQELAVPGHFAEAVTYPRVLAPMKNDRCAAAAHLTIAVSTLHNRMERAERVVGLQPSLFDDITTIPSDFMPPHHGGRLPAVVAISEKHRPPAFLTQFKLFVRTHIPIRQLQQHLFDNNSPQAMDNK